jgi:molybdopterin synthase catalytic subunit
MYLITDEVITCDAITNQMRVNTSGAIATFLGIAREFSRGRRVVYLEYQAYKPMAEKKLKEIGDEIYKKWEVDKVAIVHRTGVLKIGETSVFIAIAAPHRRAALEACAYGIERIKQIVPIWKKEIWEDGEVWIEGDPSRNAER